MKIKRSKVCFFVSFLQARYFMLMLFHMNFNVEMPSKRTRRSMAPSPSPAEGQASKPESTAIMSEVTVTGRYLLIQC